MTQTTAKIKKKELQPTLLTVDKKVVLIKVAVIRLHIVAILIALPRIDNENTSEGISHDPGPTPILKNDKYIA
jgi:hypothetical protein